MANAVMILSVLLTTGSLSVCEAEMHMFEEQIVNGCKVENNKIDISTE